MDCGKFQLKQRQVRRLDFARRMMVTALLCSTCAMPAFAQTVDQTAAPAANVAAPQAIAAPDHFMIAAFDVTGAKALDQSTVENAVYPYVGPDKTTTDVEGARKALQDAYVRQGFESVQVDVPPQPETNFAQGIIQIVVTEAPVGEVRVAGAKYHSITVVRNQVPSLAEGKPLNLQTLQTELADANRFPDRTITPSFAAGKAPGTMDVDLNVEDSLPLHGSLEINNDHSPSTKPLRLNASLRYSNLWQLGHTVTATYIVAPQDRKQVEVFSGSYTAPLLGSPWTLVLYGYKSNSNIAALGGVAVLGNGYQIGGRAIYRLPGDKLYQNVTLGVDYKHFNQNVSVGSQLASTSPIEYLPLFASYGLSMGSDKSNLDVTASLTAGLRAFKKIRCFDVTPGQTCIPTDQFKNKDFDSNENFVHANLEVEFRQVLPHDFIAAIKAYGQLSDSHLVTNEQFNIGGLSSVRGYLSAEGVGDEGYALSGELSSPSFASKLPKFVDELRLFAFAENGQTRVRNPAPDQSRHEALLSVGGGARIKLFNHFSGELSVGLPLWNGPTTRKNDVITTFSAKGQF